jgi:predicted dehydrogenase
VDESHLAKGVAQVEKAGWKKPLAFGDFRKMLEDKSIDAVSIATPNHWHTLMTILACQAGKDVYVEKPCSHNVFESQQIVAAARKYDRMVQMGTQTRSSAAVQEVMAKMREGEFGEIYMARGLCFKWRDTIGRTPVSPVPAGVDYDLWTGPAPKRDFTMNRFHYNWHWFWDYGNGDLGNQGIHQMDLARWALGENALSPRVLSVGGRLGYVDDGTTPNTFIVFHDYPTAPLIFEVRGLPSGAGSKEMDKYRSVSIGVVVDCEGGTMVIPNYSSATILDKDGAEIKKFSGSSSHFDNFIDAVRSRKSGDLHAPILEGHLSSALCHTGNISYRLGKTQPPDEMREAIRGNKDLAESLGRMEEHLGANHVDLNKAPATLGAALKMDPLTERFIGSPEADQLLTRDYRKPFVVPASV